MRFIVYAALIYLAYSTFIKPILKIKERQDNDHDLDDFSKKKTKEPLSNSDDDYLDYEEVE